ncbi:MAG: hypothetical protein ACJ71T_08085 [Actinomycetales bacterium]
MADAANLALRRGVLAVCVLDDVSLVPDTHGIQLEAGEGETVALSWQEIATAVGPVDPESEPARTRLRDWLRTRALFAELGAMAQWRAEQTAVPLGLPCGHPLHPGPAWVRQPVLGGVIDLGIGIRGLVGDDPDYVSVLPPALAQAVGLRTDGWWPALRSRLEEMGRLTVARLERDGNGLIAPMGGCDVVTLMGSQALRTHLARSDGTGLRAVAVPMRSRGWFDLARIDPAFVSAAAAATDEVDRAFWRPLLVTEEEVGLATPGGDLTTIVLRDPAPAEPAWPGA